MKSSQTPHRTSGAPCQDIEQACFELSELAMHISDQSCTSSSSLAIAALKSVSVKVPARSRVLQHSKASMVLGFSEALLSGEAVEERWTRKGGQQEEDDEKKMIGRRQGEDNDERKTTRRGQLKR